MLLIWLPFFGSSQKKVGDLTLVYNSSITNTQDTSKKINSTTSYFLKGNLSRSEVASNLFSSVTIYDSKTGSGVFTKGSERTETAYPDERRKLESEKQTVCKSEFYKNKRIEIHRRLFLQPGEGLYRGWI